MRKNKVWKQMISLALVAGMILTTTGCSKKNEDAGITTDMVVSFADDNTPVVQMTASEGCFKDNISDKIITISEITEDNVEVVNSGTEGTESEQTSETESGSAIKGIETTEPSISEAKYTDDSNISFAVNGDIKCDSQYLVVVGGDALSNGEDMTIRVNGSTLIQDIVPKVDIEKVQGSDNNPMFEITFQHGTISPTLDLEDIHLEQAFANLQIDKVMTTTGSVLTLYTTGTPGGSEFDEGLIRFSPDVFGNYNKEVVSSIKVENSDILVDYDSFTFDNGTIQGNLKLSSGTFQNVPNIALEDSDVTVTSDSLSEDKTAVAVSFVTGQTDIDAAYAAINGLKVKIPASDTSYGVDLTANIYMPKANISSHIDYISDDSGSYTATTTLFGNSGTFEAISKEDISIEGDFTDTEVTECKENEYGYEIAFTFKSEKGIDESTLNGTLTIADGKLINIWGTPSDQTQCKLYYSTEGDRGLSEALASVKALWGEYGDTISEITSVASDISTVYSTTVSVLEMFGVMKSDNAVLNEKLDNISSQVDSIAEDVKYMSRTVIDKLNSASTRSEVHFDENAYAIAQTNWTKYYTLLTDLQYEEDRYKELTESYVDSWAENSKVIHVYKGKSGKLTFPKSEGASTGYDKANIVSNYDISCPDISDSATLDDVKSYLKNMQAHKVTFDNGVEASMGADDQSLSIVDGDKITNAKLVSEDVDAIKFGDGSIVENYTKSQCQKIKLTDGTECYIGTDGKAYRMDNNKYVADYFGNADIWNIHGTLYRVTNYNYDTWDYTFHDNSVHHAFDYMFDDGVQRIYSVNCIQGPNGTIETVQLEDSLTAIPIDGKGDGIIQSDNTVKFPTTGETATLCKQNHKYIEYEDGTKTEVTIADESFENNADEIYQAFVLEMNHEIMQNPEMQKLDTAFKDLCDGISGGNYSQSFFGTYYQMLSHVYNFESQTTDDKDKMRALVGKTLLKGKQIASIYQEFHGTTIENQTTLKKKYTDAMNFSMNTLDTAAYTHEVGAGEAYCYQIGKTIKSYTMNSFADGQTWNMWGLYITRCGNFGFGEGEYSNIYNRGSLKGISTGVTLNKSWSVTAKGINANANWKSALSSADLVVMSARATKLRNTTLYADITSAFGITDSNEELTKVVTSTTEIAATYGTGAISAFDLKGVAGSTDGKMQIVMISDSSHNTGDYVDPRNNFDAYIKTTGSVYDIKTGTENNSYLFGALGYYYTRKGYEEWTAYGNHAKYLVFATN